MSHVKENRKTVKKRGKKKSKLSWLTMIHGHFPYCDVNKGNNKITVHRAIFQRERQNS